MLSVAAGQLSFSLLIGALNHMVGAPDRTIEVCQFLGSHFSRDEFPQREVCTS